MLYLVGSALFSLTFAVLCVFLIFSYAPHPRTFVPQFVYNYFAPEEIAGTKRVSEETKEQSSDAEELMEEKKELLRFRLEDRPWPVVDPWGIQEHETKDDIINRLWDELPVYRNMLLNQVKTIQVVQLKYDGMSQFMLLYKTFCGGTVFGGPPRFLARALSEKRKARRKELHSSTSSSEESSGAFGTVNSQELNHGDWKDEFSALYEIHDGFGLVNNPETELWPLVGNPLDDVPNGATWYLLPRDCIQEIPLSESSVDTGVLFGRIDKCCEAVAAADRVGFRENGHLNFSPHETQTVKHFVNYTMRNMFGVATGYVY